MYDLFSFFVQKARFVLYFLVKNGGFLTEIFGRLVADEPPQASARWGSCHRNGWTSGDEGKSGQTFRFSFLRTKFWWFFSSKTVFSAFFAPWGLWCRALRFFMFVCLSFVVVCCCRHAIWTVPKWNCQIRQLRRRFCPEWTKNGSGFGQLPDQSSDVDLRHSTCCGWVIT